MSNSNLTESPDEHDYDNYHEPIPIFNISYYMYDYYENIPNFHTAHYNYYEIILCVFSISAVCGGLPCLIWAFYSIHRQRRAKGQISAFIILLLLSDLLQLLLYPYLVIKVLRHVSAHEEYFIMGVIGCLKICSLHLQQLVALEWILTLKYPTISAHVFSYPCYIMISIIILLIPVISVVLLAFGGVQGRSVEYLAFSSILAPVCLLVVTGIIIYKSPPTAASSPVSHRPGVKVFTLSLVSLLVFCLPCVFIFCVQFLYLTYYDIVRSSIVVAICLTVIPEPLLCVLVCRENLSTETQHTQIEYNSEETLV